MAQASDNDLMAGFQDGNVHAFELLFEKYRGPVFNFLFRMLNQSRQEAEDLLQEIFLKVLKAREFYEPRTDFSAWLFSIARNHCLNFLKSRRHAQAARSCSLDDAPPEENRALRDRLASAQEVVRDVEQHELQASLEQAISTLPPEYREVFLLHAIEGYSHEEIARMLRLNPATVRTHYHRARLLLRSRIASPVPGKEPTP